MAKIIRVGVDLAKNIFHIHAVDEDECSVALNEDSNGVGSLFWINGD